MSSCQSSRDSQLVKFTGGVMGTGYNIKLINNKKLEVNELEQGAIAAMESVNQVMSTYLENSELNRFNRSPANRPFKLSDGLSEVITLALEICKFTDGAFDITVGPLVDAWGFGSDGSVEQTPSADKIEKIQRVVGVDKLKLDADSLLKLVDGIRLDLSAIAKGYAVDKVAEYLQQQGIENYLVEIGGELKASGFNENNVVWRIGVEKPNLSAGVQQVVKLENTAIATSGDYRNFITIDGKNYSHTIDPRKAEPVNHRLASVSVLDASAGRADALATALMVMGEIEAISFAENHAIAAYFVIRSDAVGDDLYKIHFTQGFAPFLVN